MVKIGVIGCGYWGRNHVRNFREIPQATLSAVCDSNPERIASIGKTYPGVAVTTDYQDLLNSDIDGVVIATPPSTHHFLAREALSRGKHVLIEKPITTNSTDTLELINLATAQNRVLMVGHTYSYNPAVDVLKEQIATGQVGQVYYVDSARLNLGLFQPDVDVLWDLAPHDISIILYLLQSEPIWVSARGAQSVNKVPYKAYVEMGFPRDIVTYIHVSWLDPFKVRRLSVVGDKKMAVFDDTEKEKIRIYDKGVCLPSNNGCNWPVTYRNGEVTVPHIPPAEPLKLECTHFAECISTGKRCKSDGRSGLRVVKILEAAEESLLHRGQRVYLEPVSVAC